MTNSSSLPQLCVESRGTRVLVSLIYCSFSITGTLANLVVIYLVYSFKKLKTTSNAFICNGCVADFLVCAFWMPQKVVLLSGPWTAVSLVYQTFMEGLLFLWVIVSMISHSLIALNRYVLITKLPAVYRTIYQKRNTEWMIAMSWVVPVVFLLPWLFGQRYPENDPKCPNQRLLVLAGKEAQLPNAYTAILSAVTILSQTSILLYCYFKILRKVQVSVKRVSVLNVQTMPRMPNPCPRKDKRLGVYVLCVCCTFVVTTEPYAWVIFWSLARPVVEGLQIASWMAFCLLLVLSPFMYTWRNEEFRRAFRSLARLEVLKGSSVGVETVSQTISQNDPNYEPG
ncbi:G protein-coupled receptor 88 [Ambystoma mexicanum]|uniref:G protein-coupled receptor 88 n=1 Tax=Ambystoma mexicanum TaxID=8296 RepID=UPI0037E7695C